MKQTDRPASRMLHRDATCADVQPTQKKLRAHISILSISQPSLKLVAFGVSVLASASQLVNEAPAASHPPSFARPTSIKHRCGLDGATTRPLYTQHPTRTSLMLLGTGLEPTQRTMKVERRVDEGCVIGQEGTFVGGGCAQETNTIALTWGWLRRKRLQSSRQSSIPRHCYFLQNTSFLKTELKI